MNMTNDFENELRRWTSLMPGHRMSDQDTAALIAYAKNAEDSKPWMWGTFHNALTNHTGLNAKDVKAEVKNARIHADLGCVPSSVEEFVPLYVRKHGYSLTYRGQFALAGGGAQDTNYVLNKMKVWCHENDSFKTTYEAALMTWMADETKAIMRRAFEHVQHDPALDPDKVELKRFVRLVVAEADNEETTARNYRAAEVAFENFIWRTKNHMRGVWHHHAHLMPILNGQPEDGKTAAMQHLFSPVEEMSASVGFDILEDNSKSYMFSTMPILFFDELAGVGKADVEKLKALMTDKDKLLRQAYERASVRTLIFNGSGCTNRDVSTVIKDETGNRRMIQFDSNLIDVRGGALDSFDPLRVWRSVNEDQRTAPMHADPEALAIVKEVQAEQKHHSAVEDWLAEADYLPLDHWSTAGDLFKLNFYPFVQEMRPGEVRLWDNQRLGAELTRISKLRVQRGPVRVSRRMRDGRARYMIEMIEGAGVTDGADVVEVGSSRWQATKMMEGFKNRQPPAAE